MYLHNSYILMVPCPKRGLIHWRIVMLLMKQALYPKPPLLGSFLFSVFGRPSKTVIFVSSDLKQVGLGPSAETTAPKFFRQYPLFYDL